ncbi:MAG: hypothetical protein SH809_13415 [Rhodothermales bacterium]|nr:hypothetical protein [Rhodothermales bacterium]
MKIQRFKTHWVFVELVFLTLVIAGPVQAQDHPARVRDLVVRLGLVDQARHQLESHIYTLRDARPDVFGEFWVEFMSTVRTDRLVDTLTIHLAASLTENDARALEHFAATPDGLDALQALTRAAPEVAALLDQWRAGIDRRLDDELAKLVEK